MSLYAVGMCCLCISIWGVIQLTFMGLFYSLEATTMIEDVEEETYADIGDFLYKTQQNYHLLSGTCYFTAYLYLGMILLSWYLIHRGREQAKTQEEKMRTAEGICGPEPD